MFCARPRRCQLVRRVSPARRRGDDKLLVFYGTNFRQTPIYTLSKSSRSGMPSLRQIDFLQKAVCKSNADRFLAPAVRIELATNP